MMAWNDPGSRRCAHCGVQTFRKPHCMRDLSCDGAMYANATLTEDT